MATPKEVRAAGAQKSRIKALARIAAFKDRALAKRDHIVQKQAVLTAAAAAPATPAAPAGGRNG